MAHNILGKGSRIRQPSQKIRGPTNQATTLKSEPLTKFNISCKLSLKFQLPSRFRLRPDYETFRHLVVIEL